MTIPAVMTILDLATTATATSSMRLEASYTTANGNATTVQVSLTQIMTTIFGGLPTGGGTGQILSKVNSADYSTQWSNIASAVLGTTGITTSGSTTVMVEFAAATPLSVLGVAGTATAAPLPIVAAAGGQVLQSNAGNTGLLFAGITTTILPSGATSLPLVGAGAGNPPNYAVLSVPGGGSGTTTLTTFGVVYGNGTSTVGITAAGTTAWPLVGNGTAAAPSFQQVNLTTGVTGVLTVPFGGIGTASLPANGVVLGNGSSPLSVAAAATSTYVLVATGTNTAPNFQLINLGLPGQFVTGVLTVPSGGSGTSTLTAFGLLYGNGSSTIGIIAATTAGLFLQSQGTAAAPAWTTGTLPTTQVFLSGSGTYTTPATARWIDVELIGGGGGGGGSGTTPGAGGTGGNTTFGTALLVGNGGTGGQADASPGVGGSASGGYLNETGNGGMSGTANSTSPGSAGGMTRFASFGFGGQINQNGSAAGANTGGGGGGAGDLGTPNTGAGGGAGGYVRAILTSLNTTYAYAVGGGGAGGTAGTSGQAGGAGGSGIIVVIEHYGT